MKRKNPFREIYDKDLEGDFPNFVDIELTNHCNLNCIFCSRNIMKREKGYMEDQTFKKIIDECAIHNTPVRFIRWGEPISHPKIIEFCKYVKSKNLLLHITTNGILLSKKITNQLIEIGVDSIIFSFQGSTKERYEIMRNTDKYDTLRRNIKRLNKYRGDKPYIQITSTMLNDTEKNIKRFTKYWEKYSDLITTGRTNMSRLSDNIPKNAKYLPCIEVLQKLSVDWDGKVTACCGDYDNLMTIGDINEKSLYDIWNNNQLLDSYRTILKDMKHKSLTLCSKCYPAYENINDKSDNKEGR